MGSTTKVIPHAVLTYGRSWSTLAAVRSLGKRGVRVHVGDCTPLGAATFSKYVESTFIYPPINKEIKFVNAVIKKCKEIRKRYGGDILLLPIHEETYILAKHKKKLPKYVQFECANHKLLEQIQNKSKVIKVAKKYGADMPKSWVINKSIQKNIIFPAYLKKPVGSGSVGIRRIKTVEELKKYASKGDVVQEEILGKDYCACALLDHGKPIAFFTYTAIKTYPARGGTTVYRKTVNKPKIEKEAMKILKGVKWHGVAELDYRIDKKTGKAKLIEINPRFWGGLNQAIHSNLDFPYLLWRMAEGHQLERINKISDNVRTANFAGALASTIQELTGVGPITAAMRKFITKPNNENMTNLSKSFSRVIPYYRRSIVNKYINKNIKEDIYNKEDPGPMAGILFPLAVFARHGKINNDLLINEK